MHDAIARVSETLFRVANSADLTGLSLEVDLFGKELAHEGEEREKGDEKNGEVKAKAPPIAIEPSRIHNWATNGVENELRGNSFALLR